MWVDVWLGTEIVNDKCLSFYCLAGWMFAWMNECMDEWIVSSLDEWMDFSFHIVMEAGGNFIQLP